MWSALTDNIIAGVAAVTAVAGLAGAWIKLRPRRIIGWLSAVKERETLLAMLEHEKQSGLYWRQQAQECIKDFQDQYRTDASVDSGNDSPAGGGPRSSSGEAGPTQKERWTG